MLMGDNNTAMIASRSVGEDSRMMGIPIEAITSMNKTPTPQWNGVSDRRIDVILLDCGLEGAGDANDFSGDAMVSLVGSTKPEVVGAISVLGDRRWASPWLSRCWTSLALANRSIGFLAKSRWMILSSH